MILKCKEFIKSSSNNLYVCLQIRLVVLESLTKADTRKPSWNNGKVFAVLNNYLLSYGIFKQPLINDHFKCTKVLFVGPWSIFYCFWNNKIWRGRFTTISHTAINFNNPHHWAINHVLTKRYNMPRALYCALYESYPWINFYYWGMLGLYTIQVHIQNFWFWKAMKTDNGAG